MKHLPRLSVIIVAFALADVAAAAEGAEAEPSIVPSFATSVIPAVVTLIVFAGLVAILGKYAWGPISKGLEDRENKIRRDIEQAEQARLRAEQRQAEYERRLAESEAKVREMMAQAQRDAESLQTRIKTDAEADAQTRLEKAARDIEANKDAAVGEIRSETAALATAIAEKILGRAINEDDQRKLIDDSLDQVDRLQPAGA